MDSKTQTEGKTDDSDDEVTQLNSTTAKAMNVFMHSFHTNFE